MIIDPFVVEIELTQGQVALVDADDFIALEMLSYSWHAVRKDHTYYARTSIKNDKGKFNQRYMHNFLLGFIGVDHINGNGLDNRRCNLRPATQHQNNGNYRKKAGTSSIYKGVTWDDRSDKWRAAINCNGKKIYLGLYIDESDAAIAYDRAAKEYFGEYARTNDALHT